MRRRYARLVVRARWPIVVAWLVGATLSAALLPGVGGGGSLGTLVPTDSSAIDAERRAAEVFGFPVLSRVLVVERRLPELTQADAARVVRASADLSAGSLPDYEDSIFAAFPIVNRIGPGSLVRARDTTAITYLLMNPEFGTGRATNRARRFVDAEVRPVADTVGLTGVVPAHAEQVHVIADRLPLVELGTVLLVAIAVGLHFRSVVAPVLVLLSIAMPYLVAIGVVSALGETVDLAIPKEVEPVMVVLLFGILTDYALFLLSRFRRLLESGEAPAAAAEGTIADQVGIIATAGIAVMAGTASLAVAQLSFFRAFGPGVALSVGVGLLAALTFLPASLAILGRRVFWPSRLGRQVPASRAESLAPVHSRSLELAARRPVLVTAVCVVVLGALATGVARLDTGQTLIRGLPSDAGPRQAYDEALRGFVPGVVSPTLVLVEGSDVAGQREVLKTLQSRLAGVNGVAAVVGAREQRLSEEYGVVYSPNGDAARLLVIFDADPLGARAIDAVQRVQLSADLYLKRADIGARATVAGDTAIAAEVVNGTSGDLGRIGPLVAVLIVAIMAVFLRALVAPLYMLLASALGLAAALGLTVYVFQDIAGYQELTYYVPFVAAVLLLSLGSDYTVFLAGRVWEEARRRPMREAVVIGGSRAASAITVAGLVLALSFALLALVPLRSFRELAFVMTFGLLLDAFVVRTLLVPALMALFGDRSAWPGHTLSARSAQAPAPGPVVDDDAR